LTHPKVSAEPEKLPVKPLEFPVEAYRRYDVSKIAKTDSTSVFPGVFPALLEYAVLWVKFSEAQGCALIIMLSLLVKIV
jgi:hypothetical protein